MKNSFLIVCGFLCFIFLFFCTRFPAQSILFCVSIFIFPFNVKNLLWCFFFLSPGFNNYLFFLLYILAESFGISHPPLMRDDFYEFHCSSCTNGPIYYKRKPMSWLQVIWLSMYNLLISDPSKKFVKWKDELCSFIDIHWENLTPGKKSSILVY